MDNIFLKEEFSLANQELKDKLHTEMDKVAHTFNRFKEVQLTQDGNLVAFKAAKKELRDRLGALNSLLNEKLYKSTNENSLTPIETWLQSHQPFHWLAEFYEIIHDNGGFDVIVGNPPYVEYNKKVKGIAVSDIYKIRGYKTISCGNLYAYCIERSKVILNDFGSFFGMIVPLSLSCGNRMDILRSFVEKGFTSNYYSNFEIFPSKLFDGAFQRITIVISNNIHGEKRSMITKLHRWYSVERKNLFGKIHYTRAVLILPEIGIAKFNTHLHASILQKVVSFLVLGNYVIKDGQSDFIYYQEATNYWMKSAMRIPYYKKNGSVETPAHGRLLKFNTSKDKQVVFGLINSSLFYSWYIAFSDGFHLSDNVVKRFPVDSKLMGNNDICLLSSRLQSDIDNNSFTTTRNTARSISL